MDVVAILTDSVGPKQYIKKMRSRDLELNSNWGTICTPVEMIAADGKIHDENRIAFLDQYLHYYRKASDEDIPVAGYFVWSLMDNFEWAFGYTERFGIVYVDYTSQERTIKESGKWYKKVIGSNGEIIK